jgi:anti-anti-sigma regulatory factor
MESLKLEGILIMTKSICSARLITGSQTLVLTLNSGTYGSLELDLLEQLAAEFREWSLATSANDMIVDLSKVTAYGSGLLGCLARFREQLASMRKRLVICGDQSGVVAHVGWSQLMDVQPDLKQALEHSLRSAV